MSVKETQLQQWMIAAQAGDKQAYQELLNALESIFRRFSIGLGVRIDDSDDVVQNALIAIHSSRHTYLPNHSFLGWAFAICRKKINDHLRATYRIKQLEIYDESLLFNFFKEEVDGVDHDAQYETALQMLNELPATQKKIVTAIKVEQRRIKEIAESLNMSEAAVKTTAHRGYKKLKEILKQVTKKREV